MTFPYRKILILGNGGAGKSTFAADMGRAFSLPVVHLDRLWWLPGWVNRTQGEFDALLCRELAKPAWVMDGNYHRTLALRLAAADAAVFLDIPAAECLRSARLRAEQYAGRTRPDMADGCPERVDAEFEAFILDYERTVRPAMLAQLRESRKPCFVFSSRRDAGDWLQSFQGNKSTFS